MLQEGACTDSRLSSVPVSSYNWLTIDSNDNLWLAKRNFIDSSKHNIIDEVLNKTDNMLSVIEVEYLESDGKSILFTGVSCTSY